MDAIEKIEAIEKKMDAIFELLVKLNKFSFVSSSNAFNNLLTSI